MDEQERALGRLSRGRITLDQGDRTGEPLDAFRKYATAAPMTPPPIATSKEVFSLIRPIRAPPTTSTKTGREP
jgi:hypothetical protein